MTVQIILIHQKTWPAGGGDSNSWYGPQRQIYISLALGTLKIRSRSSNLQTTKVQTSLRIHTVWSAPLLFTYWKVSYQDLLERNFNFLASLCSWAGWLNIETQRQFSPVAAYMIWGNLLVEISDDCGSRPIYRSCFHHPIMSGFVNNVTTSSIV